MKPHYDIGQVSTKAVVPEQVTDYVTAVAGSRPRLFDTCIGYVSKNQIVLIGYPLHDPLDKEALENGVALALAVPGLQTLSVIATEAPKAAPPDAAIIADSFFSLPLPAPQPGPKLANLLRRASRELTLIQERSLAKDHLALVAHYLNRLELAEGSRHIFKNLSQYVRNSQSSLVFSVRRTDGRLAAFSIGEFASKHTAMFMFCFRDPAIAPPGSADLTLSGLINEAQKRGHTRLNLGLGVNDGIRFFKRKWGAAPFLPCVDTTWAVRKSNIMSCLRSLLTFKR